MGPLAPTSVLLYTKKRGIPPGTGKVVEAPDAEDRDPWDQDMEVQGVVAQATEVVPAAVHISEADRMTSLRMVIDEVGLALAAPMIADMVIEAAVRTIEDVGVLVSVARMTGDMVKEPAVHTIEAMTVVDRGAEPTPVEVSVMRGHPAQALRAMVRHKTVDDPGAEATPAEHTVVRERPAQVPRVIVLHKTADDQGVPTPGVVSGPAAPVF